MANINRNPVYDGDYVTLEYLREYLGEEKDGEQVVYSKNFGMQPKPPYHVNDTWTDTSGRLYVCIAERLIGDFNAADWEVIIDTEPYDKLVFEYSDITIDMLMSQVYDHKIESHISAVDPSLDWDTYITKEYHVYDFWRDTNTDKEYVYIRRSGNPITYVWDEHVCPAIVWNTVSGHKSIFNNTPSNYKTHDLWLIDETTAEEDIPDGYFPGQWVSSNTDNEGFDKNDWSLAIDKVDLSLNVPRVYSRIEIDRYNNVLEDSVQSSLLQTENSIMATVKSTYATQETVKYLDSELGELRDVTTEQTNQISMLSVTTGRIESNVSEINTKLNDVNNITVSGDSVLGFVPLQSINASNPIQVRIRPIESNIAYTYPHSTLFPSSSLFSTVRIVRFHNKTTGQDFDYTIPTDLFYYDEDNYDELVMDYDNGTVNVTRKCTINSDGVVSVLPETAYEPYDYPYDVMLSDGDYDVYLVGYNKGYLYVSLMASNVYTTRFATKSELNSSITQTESAITSEVSATYATKNALKTTYDTLNSTITQTASTINATVSQKLDGNKFNSANIMLTINNDGVSNASINADKINIQGVLNAVNNDTTTTINGNKITTGTIDADKLQANSITSDKLQANSITSDKIQTNAITTDKISSGAIDASKVSSDIITAYNFSAQQINANNITSGTINADRLDTSRINSTSGYIGGWRIENTGLYKTVGNYTFEIRTDRPADQASFAVWDAGNNRSNFYVRPDGYLYARSADISGHINATSGTFSGTVYANSGLFSGSIYSESGTIGGWTIKTSKLRGNIGQYGIYGAIRPYGVQLEDENGTVLISAGWGNVINASTSDKRLKNNITTIDDKYEKLFNDLKPITFYFNEEIDDSNKKHIGFIAQDVLESEQIINEDLAMVYQDKMSDKYHLDKQEIVALNTWQIQKLKTKVNEQQKQIDYLMNEINKLKESDSNDKI